jgi:uncharacterized membrane protein YeaQ/YmgE (transglycosylase-associated protein family)
MTTPQVTIPPITIPSFVITLIIAGLCGALAQLLVGFTRGGCIASILVGFIGALVGSWLAAQLGLPPILNLYGIDIVWTIIGSALFAALLALILGGSRRPGWYRWRRNY